MNKKIIHRVVSIIVLYFGMAGSFGFACAECSTAPEDFKQYFDVMSNLVKLLETHPGVTADQSTTLPDELGGEGTRDPRAGIIGMADRLSRMGQTASLVTAQYLRPHLDGTTFSEIAVLASGPILTRDWKLLLEIDAKISNAFMKSYSGNYLSVPLSDDVLIQIDEELQKTEYMRLGSVGDDYIMRSSGAQYRDFGKLLWQLNGVFKKIHSKMWFNELLKDSSNERAIANLDDPDEAVELPVESDLVLIFKDIVAIQEQYLSKLAGDRSGTYFDRIEFDDENTKFVSTVRQIHEDYHCAIGVKNACDEDWLETVKSSWEHTKDIFMGDAKSAIGTFKVAFSRLKGALFIGNDDDMAAAQQRQNQLLHSIYGQDLQEYKKRFENSGGDIEANTTQTAHSMKGLKRILSRVTNNRFLQISGFAGSSETTKFINNGVEMAKDLVKREKDNPDNFETKDEKEEKIKEIQEYIDEVTDVARGSDNTDMRSFINQSAVNRETRSLQQTYLAMIEFQESLTTHAIMMDPYEFTKQFPALSNAVHTNMKLVGTQGGEGDTKGMYHYMGEVCSQQCAENLQGRCWYDA